MNWPNKKLSSFLPLLTVVLTAFWLAGCGVKGDPLPPEKPVELGRGRPTYKRATEGIKIEKTKRANAKEEKDDKEQEDEDGDK